MGAVQAAEFAQATKNGEIDLDAALTWHFRSNHYPPLPLSLIPIAKRIIEGKAKGSVRLPKGITYRGSVLAPVRECIQAWHLQEFLKE